VDYIPPVFITLRCIEVLFTILCDILKAISHTPLTVRHRTIGQQRKTRSRVKFDHVGTTITINHNVYTREVQTGILEGFHSYTAYLKGPFTPTYYVKASALRHIPRNSRRVSRSLLSHCSYPSRDNIHTILCHFVDQFTGVPPVTEHTRTLMHYIKKLTYTIDNKEITTLRVVCWT
jgi:hypothetical protein